MSRTETHFGKIKKIELQNKTIEQFFQEKCIENSIFKIDKGYNTWKETYFDNISYEKYFIVNNVVWEAIEHTEIDEGDDISIITPNADGTLSFIMQFYNGGTCLSEIIEEGLKNINNESTQED